MSALSKHEIKALAIELAAALPPAHGEPRRQTASTGPADVHEALARLSQAEQVLEMTSAWLREEGRDRVAWQASEALAGALRLLDGCYATLGNATDSAEHGGAAAAH